MKDGMFVFDAAIHVQDFTDRQIKEGDRSGRVGILRNQLTGFIDLTARKGPPANAGFHTPPDVDWAHSTLFEKSDTDLAMACSVPLFSHWKAGLGPVELSYELCKRDPKRILLTGGVDPAYHGLDFALREMERQVKEWGAVSMKFYQYQQRGCSWRADDRDIQRVWHVVRSSEPTELALPFTKHRIPFYTGSGPGHALRGR